MPEQLSPALSLFSDIHIYLEMSSTDSEDDPPPQESEEPAEGDIMTFNVGSYTSIFTFLKNDLSQQVQRLKEELILRGLPTSGSRSDLVVRLNAFWPSCMLNFKS